MNNHGGVVSSSSPHLLSTATFPVDCMLHLMPYLDIEDVFLGFAQTCRDWYRLVFGRDAPPSTQGREMKEKNDDERRHQTWWSTKICEDLFKLDAATSSEYQQINEQVCWALEKNCDPSGFPTYCLLRYFLEWVGVIQRTNNNIYRGQRGCKKKKKKSDCSHFYMAVGHLDLDWFRMSCPLACVSLLCKACQNEEVPSPTAAEEAPSASAAKWVLPNQSCVGHQDVRSEMRNKREPLVEYYGKVLKHHGESVTLVESNHLASSYVAVNTTQHSSKEGTPCIAFGIVSRTVPHESTKHELRTSDPVQGVGEARVSGTHIDDLLRWFEQEDKCHNVGRNTILGRNYLYIMNGAAMWRPNGPHHMKTVAAGLHDLDAAGEAANVSLYQQRLRVGLGIIHSKLSEATLLADCRELDENFERSGTLPFRLMLLATLDHQGLLALIQFDRLATPRPLVTSPGVPLRVLHGQH